jgi:hypothetical protein
MSRTSALRKLVNPDADAVDHREGTRGSLSSSTPRRTGPFKLRGVNSLEGAIKWEKETARLLGLPIPRQPAKPQTAKCRSAR